MPAVPGSTRATTVPSRRSKRDAQSSMTLYVTDPTTPMPFDATADITGAPVPVTSYFSDWDHVAPIKIPAAKTALPE